MDDDKVELLKEQSKQIIDTLNEFKESIKIQFKELKDELHSLSKQIGRHDVGLSEQGLKIENLENEVRELWEEHKKCDERMNNNYLEIQQLKEFQKQYEKKQSMTNKLLIVVAGFILTTIIGAVILEPILNPDTDLDRKIDKIYEKLEEKNNE